ncbi:MAG TPA: translation initiation factor IF-3 [Firmicutes bacterium]|nr:translation initiation factor IF-3 [Bacillota bacterium]
MNDQIRVREVLVIDENGTKLGVLQTRDALRIAEEKALDLVEVSPNSRPPVCKLMDYGRFRYEQAKKEREARKKQRITDLKEVRMTPKIEDHDFAVKTKATEKFLRDGDKVKVVIRFRGREIVHADLAQKLMNEMAQQLTAIAGVEREPKVEGRNMIMILSPKQS